ncbi:hypothetical protein PUNSTDRAFT_132500 [Punctularia strigosozonata HHB-11173 SS5]|uniref:uncharacterized protein n=1 Tax=Punctularia strigosozonata (strain HHB-11173) TaxID=741275 RepID=UPI00044175DE|nr:uncharacterized protein PUNSTDRAFT_132500 [Punctularia strigosozonata HHB-11173 SS5]EIN10406.1 hypothetical protein PUNSTDRAFT_132500 [Punctularia strigosozonata HHB-11173 SS5]
MVHQISAPLPTPPTSPSLSEPQLVESRGSSTRPALQLLDQLVNFYQQERVWVHHTRAALFELAMASSAAAGPSLSTSTSDDPSPSSTHPDELPAADPHSGVPDVTVKSEPVDVDMALAGLSKPDRHTRWMRRKNSMRLQLKLDGISPATRGRSRRRRGDPAPPPPVPQIANLHHHQLYAAEVDEPLMPGEHGARLLQQFGDLMDARMESCQRVTRLVQEAGRQDLLYGDR